VTPTPVRDHGGQALAYVYFEEEPSRRSPAKLLTKGLRESDQSLQSSDQ
jgi:hypothetical protein